MEKYLFTLTRNAHTITANALQKVTTKKYILTIGVTKTLSYNIK